MANVAIAIFVTIVIIGSIKMFLKFVKDLKFSGNVPCPGLPLPLVGHSHFLMNINREDILETILDIASAVDQKCRKMGLVLGPNQLIFYFHPEPVEEILSSYQYISKSSEYVPLLVSPALCTIFTILLPL